MSVTPSRAAAEVIVDGLDDARALATWLEAVRRFKSPHTARSYEREAVRFRMWLEWHRGADDPRLLRTARAADANRYLDFLNCPVPLPAALLSRYARTEQPFAGPLKASSLRQAVVILSGMYARFKEIEDLDGQPYAQFDPFALVRGTMKDTVVPKNSLGLLPAAGKAFSRSTWAAIERHLVAEVAARPDDPHAHRDRWVVKFLYLAWLRREEAAQALMGHFVEDQAGTGAWSFIVAAGKGGERVAIVATRPLMDALRAYREFLGLPPYPAPMDTRPAVAPLRGEGTMTGDVINKIARRVFAAVAQRIAAVDPAGADQLTRATAHWLRHTGISHAADAGVDVKYVSKQARHADIRITMATYYHPERDAMRGQLEEAAAKGKASGSGSSSGVARRPDAGTQPGS
jgi:integrase